MIRTALSQQVPVSMFSLPSSRLQIPLSKHQRYHYPGRMLHLSSLQSCMPPMATDSFQAEDYR